MYAPNREKYTNCIPLDLLSLLAAAGPRGSCQKVGAA